MDAKTAKNFVNRMESMIRDACNSLAEVQAIHPGDFLIQDDSGYKLLRLDGIILSVSYNYVQLAMDGRSLSQCPPPGYMSVFISDIYAISPQESSIVPKRSCPTRWKSSGQIIHIYQMHSGGLFVAGPWWETMQGGWISKFQLDLHEKVKAAQKLLDDEILAAEEPIRVAKKNW